MSLPKSKILSVSKGFAANTEVYHESPNQTQVVNVNISKEQKPAKNEEEKSELAERIEPVVSEKVDSPDIVDFKESVANKDNIIEAYSLLLKIVESNPLVINKYIIAKGSELAQLIQLLTDAERVDINKTEDVECHCFNASVSYSAIEKIYVVKDGQTFNFKYNFSNANKILDEHHISKKFVIDE